MCAAAVTYFKSHNGTLEDDIDQCVDDYAPAITSKHPSTNEPGARVAIGEGFRVYIGLINDDASTALSQASKLGNMDWNSSTALVLPPRGYYRGRDS